MLKLETLLLTILSALIIYLAGSFAAASFNIKDWEAICRFLCSVLWFASVMFIIALYFTKTEGK